MFLHKLLYFIFIFWQPIGDSQLVETRDDLVTANPMDSPRQGYALYVGLDGDQSAVGTS